MSSRFPCVFVIATVLTGILSACEQQPLQVFMPPDGDAAKGRQVFIEYGCHNCHSIPDVDFPERTSEPPMELQLGGRIYRVTSFGDLLTSIIYPDHVVSPKFTAALESAGKDPDSIRMLNFTDEMTVAELIDLVEFLDGEYTRLLGRQYQAKEPRPGGRLRNIGND